MVEKVLQINREKTIFWSLLTILFISIFFYMYFINTTIHNVVLRQNLEAEASKLSLSIGNEEFQYITKRNEVTLQLAYSLGFKEVSDKTFVYRNPSRDVAYLSR
jgi:hypothetical protein